MRSLLSKETLSSDRELNQMKTPSHTTINTHEEFKCALSSLDKLDSTFDQTLGGLRKPYWN